MPCSTSCTARPISTWPGVLVHLIERTASAPMGRDENGRYEHADTYHLLAHRPNARR